MGKGCRGTCSAFVQARARTRAATSATLRLSEPSSSTSRVRASAESTWLLDASGDCTHSRSINDGHHLDTVLRLALDQSRTSQAPDTLLHTLYTIFKARTPASTTRSSMLDSVCSSCNTPPLSRTALSPSSTPYAKLPTV